MATQGEEGQGPRGRQGGGGEAEGGAGQGGGGAVEEPGKCVCFFLWWMWSACCCDGGSERRLSAQFGCRLVPFSCVCEHDGVLCCPSPPLAAPLLNHPVPFLTLPHGHHHTTQRWVAHSQQVLKEGDVVRLTKGEHGGKRALVTRAAGVAGE